MPDYDVAVVGASIAGTAVATLLGRQGYSVWLADRAHFPRPKICGEGLMPEGVRLLKQLGMSATQENSRISPFRGLRLQLPDGTCFELLFSELGDSIKGLVTDRAVLDRLLLERASATPNVALSEETEIQSVSFHSDYVTLFPRTGSPITSRLVIGANGIHSNLHHQAGLKREIRNPRRMALRTFFPEVEQLEGVVEVFTSDGAEAYLAPMGPGARVTILFENEPSPTRPRKGSDLRGWYGSLLGYFPLLAKRLPPVISDRVEATAPVTLLLPACHAHRLILVGDAAGASDPIAGQGMSQALKDAFLAGELLTGLLKEDHLECADLADYTRLRQKTFARSIQVADTLLHLARHPRLARRAVGALSRNDSLRWKILNAVAGNGDGVLSRWDKLRLMVGM